MEYAELQWQTKDGLTVMTREWKTGDAGRGIICLVHGLGEHSGRYDHVASALVKLGFSVLASDLRGHGRTQGPRGHTPSYEALMGDIDLLLAKAAEFYPDHPCYLYGHSMGGNLVLNYVLRRQSELAGIIVTSPWLQLAFNPPKIKIWLAELMNSLWPSLSQPSGLKARDLTQDDLVLERLNHDTNAHDRITVRMFTEIDRAGKWALAHAAEWRLPLLMMHGGNDQITSVQASQLFALSAACNELKSNQETGLITYHLWDGLSHEIHNEPQQEEVFAYIADWINR